MLAGAVKQPGLRKGSGRGKPAPAHTEPGAGSGLREGAALLVLQAAGQTRALPFSAGGFRGSLDMSPQGVGGSSVQGHRDISVRRIGVEFLLASVT